MLKFVEKLRAAGVPEEQAKAISEELLVDRELAVNGDEPFRIAPLQ